jgi:hypothetical protein
MFRTGENQNSLQKRSDSVCGGGNGSGKTAIFQALSRLFGVTKNQRTIQVSDFHLAEVEEIKPGATLSIDAVFCFPELDGLDDKAIEDAVPEYFLQMAASEPGGPLKVRMKLKAKWIDDGTPEGTVEEDLRWVHTISGTYSWDDCTKVQALERGSIQLIYVPANREGFGKQQNGRINFASRVRKARNLFRKDSRRRNPQNSCWKDYRIVGIRYTKGIQIRHPCSVWLKSVLLNWSREQPLLSIRTKRDKNESLLALVMDNSRCSTLSSLPPRLKSKETHSARLLMKLYLIRQKSKEYV